jgi:hypothetical protein
MGDPAEENDPPPESRICFPKSSQQVNRNFERDAHLLTLIKTKTDLAKGNELV